MPHCVGYTLPWLVCLASGGAEDPNHLRRSRVARSASSTNHGGDRSRNVAIHSWLHGAMIARSDGSIVAHLCGSLVKCEARSSASLPHRKKTAIPLEFSWRSVRGGTRCMGAGRGSCRRGVAPRSQCKASSQIPCCRMTSTDLVVSCPPRIRGTHVDVVI